MSYSNYIGLVVAKPEGEMPQLFRAPRWSSITVGQNILVEDTENSDEGKLAVVIDYESGVNNDPEDDTIRMAMKVSCTEQWPLRKVLAVYAPLDWSDYETEETESTEED